ncbi:HAAS signaling domain-containing protein [Blastococcus xanthinilyticus]|uniref:Uncharacterized protein n=1 Tax=Blastococcus xanthinilyticus TaxID=1564164 RepID=A0A5S5CKD0_9ACTN|nr:hypothetical protein [Blastococcus xanthinilyticus]TYP80651.1 hypothetical protein BD833_12918 [Blastococcus xanthinilyticus]
MTTDTATYRRDLLRALRSHHVAPERMGEIVAEVESHVAETGETPVEAFGPAAEYAAGFAGPRPLTARLAGIGLMVLGLACGWLIANGIFGLVTDERVHGMPAGVALLVGALLWLPPMVGQLRRQQPVADPRTGRRITPGPGAVVASMSVFLVLLAGVTWLLALLTQ